MELLGDHIQKQIDPAGRVGGTYIVGDCRLEKAHLEALLFLVVQFPFQTALVVRRLVQLFHPVHLL